KAQCQIRRPSTRADRHGQVVGCRNRSRWTSEILQEVLAGNRFGVIDSLGEQPPQNRRRKLTERSVANRITTADASLDWHRHDAYRKSVHPDHNANAAIAFQVENVRHGSGNLGVDDADRSEGSS